MRRACLALLLLSIGSAEEAIAAPGPTLAQLPGASGCISGDPTDVECTRARARYFSPALALSPDGRNVYATSLGEHGGIVVTFRRHPVTGALTEAGCVAVATHGCRETPGLLGATSSSVSPDGRNVYTVANGFSPGTAGALVTLSRDLVTSELQPQACTGGTTYCEPRDLAVAGASAVTVSPDGRHVYVRANGRLLTFERDVSGSVRRVDCIGSESGCRRDADLANECKGAAPGMCNAFGAFVGNQLVLSPDGRHLYAANDRMRPGVFSRDPVSGTIAPAPCGPDQVACDAAPFDSPGLAIAPGGRDVYMTSWRTVAGPVGDHWRYSLLSLRRDVAGGGLRPFDCLIEARPRKGCHTAATLGNPSGVAVSADGGAVYAAFGAGLSLTPNGGVAVLRRNRETGRLSESGCVSSTGSDGLCVQGPGLAHSRSVLVSPDGRSVYVAGDGGRIAVLGPAVGLERSTIRFSRRGVARTRLRCPRIARVRCRGTLVLRRASGTGASASASRLAARRFSIRPGRRALVKVRLSRSGRRVLRRGRRMSGRALIRTTGRVSGRPVQRVTLRRR